MWRMPSFFFSSRRRHTRLQGDWSSDVCSSDLWSVLVGSASLFYAALEMGCDGGVLAAACFAGRLCADLQAAYRAGDRARAGRLQERLTPLDKEIVGKLGPAGVKAAMDAVGLYGGAPPAPPAPGAPAPPGRAGPPAP